MCVCVCAMCAQAVNRKPFVTFIRFACGFKHMTDDRRIFNLIFHWPLFVSEFCYWKNGFSREKRWIENFLVFFFTDACLFRMVFDFSSLVLVFLVIITFAYTFVALKIVVKIKFTGLWNRKHSLGSHSTVNLKAEIVATFKFYSTMPSTLSSNRWLMVSLIQQSNFIAATRGHYKLLQKQKKIIIIILFHYSFILLYHVCRCRLS